MLVLVRLVHQNRVDAEVVEVLEVLPAVEKVARPRLDVPRPYGVAPFAQLLRLVLRCLLQLAGLAVHAVLPQHADHLLRLLALHRDVALLALLGVVDAVEDGLRDDDHVPVVVADLRVEVLPLLLAGVPFAQAKHLGVRVQRAGALGELGQRGVLHDDHGLAGDAQLVTLKEAARLLSISQPYLYKLNKEGRLPFVKLAPRCNRVRLSDVRTLGQLGQF